MDKIRNSVFGYNKADVNNMIAQKDSIIKTQQQDINYLRNENKSLKKQTIKEAKNKNV